MEFKKIIKNEDLRYWLSGLLDFIPDKWMVKFMYRFKVGRKLNLDNPKRFSEKIQWYKLNYRNPLMKICTDKLLVREFVAEKGYSEILNEILGIYNTPEEIDFTSLPDRFVIKMTSGSGGNIIINDKNNIDTNLIEKKLNKWLKDRPANVSGEWAYNKESKIIIEKMLPLDASNELIDYKIFCFNGKAEYLYLYTSSFYKQQRKERNFFDLDFNKLPYQRVDYPTINKEIKKPKNFDKMVRIAEKLSEEFPHVRIDLFNINGEVIFGEMTFYHASGFVKYSPDEFDYVLGDKFKLPDE